MMSAWDRAPYTTIATSIPFAYIGGKFVLTTAQYDAGTISRMSFRAAASIMSSGASAVAGAPGRLGVGKSYLARVDGQVSCLTG